uniref:Interferon lambda-4-like n=1 Tax=Moschus moschiferus TaxID=68415 RepID=A0A8C6FFP4_MOSMO
MEQSRAAAVAVGLWVLAILDVAANPNVTEPQRCLLSHYRSLDPRALLAVKALRDHYEEETLSWGPQNCSIRPKRNPPRPSSCAMLRRVARDLADAQAVLSRLPSPELFPGVGQTLELLAAAGRDVAACVSARRPGPAPLRLDSPRCHEATVIFQLLRLLAWDLRLVARAGPCL